jgi:hypothetical protein
MPDRPGTQARHRQPSAGRLRAFFDWAVREGQAVSNRAADANALRQAVRRLRERFGDMIVAVAALTPPRPARASGGPGGRGLGARTLLGAGL